jgi:hypothetical protein
VTSKRCGTKKFSAAPTGVPFRNTRARVSRPWKWRKCRPPLPHDASRSASTANVVR